MLVLSQNRPFVPLSPLRTKCRRQNSEVIDRARIVRARGRDRMVIYKIKSLEYFSRTNPTPGVGVG